MSRMTPEIETIHGVVGITDAFLQEYGEGYIVSDTAVCMRKVDQLMASLCLSFP